MSEPWMTPVGCSTNIPETPFQNMMAKRRACQAKCHGTAGILKQLGATMSY